MDSQEKRLDQELAAFTDSLLEGQPMRGPERPPLADTVEMLARTTKRQHPPASLRTRVKQHVSAEWDRQQQPIHHRIRSLGLFGRRWRWVPISAAVLVVLALAALILPDGTLPIQGTIIGSHYVVPILLAGMAAVLVGVWLVARRK